MRFLRETLAWPDVPHASVFGNEQAQPYWERLNQYREGLSASRDEMGDLG